MPRPTSSSKLTALALASSCMSAEGLRSVARNLPLCAPQIVAETCAKVAGHGAEISPQDLSEVFSAEQDEVRSAWHALVGGARERVPCQDLCAASVDFASTFAGMPSESDTGCYFLRGALRCDVDVRPQTLQREQRRAAESEVHSEDGKAGPFFGQHGGPEGTKVRQVRYTAQDLSLRILGLFRIFPASPHRSGAIGARAPSFLEGEDEEWELAAKKTNVQARAYLETAIKEFKESNTKMQLEQWFGPGASEDEEVRAEVQRMLNSVQGILSNIAYAYPGQYCNEITIAYVLPKAGGGVEENCAGVLPAEGENCVKNSEDQYVYYLCPSYLTEPLSAQIGAQLHEASHHGSAFTDDVCMNEFYFGRESATYMAVPRSMVMGGKGRIGDEVMVPYTDDDIERFKHHAEFPYVQAQIHSQTEEEVVVKIFQADLDDACISEESQKAFDVRFCLDLARLDTTKALRNADNFRYFVEHVVSGESKGETCSRNLDYCVGEHVTYTGSEPLAMSEGSEKFAEPGEEGIVQYPHFDLDQEVRVRDDDASEWKVAKVTSTVPLRVDGYIWDHVRAKEGEPEFVVVRFGDNELATKVPAQLLSAPATPPKRRA